MIFLMLMSWMKSSLGQFFDRGKCTGYMYLVFNLLNSKNSNTFIKAYHKFTKCKCSLKKMSRVHSNIDVLLHDPCILGELNNAK